MGDPNEETIDEAEHVGGCGEHCETPPAETAPVAVAREETNTITVFDADSEDDVRGWPRRMCIRTSGRTRTHGLWYPEASGAARFHAITDADLTRYRRVTGHDRRGATSTWGEKTTIEVPVSQVVTAEDGSLVLQFDATGPRYSYDVYGLEVQPAWRQPLERTLMLLPLSLLRASGLKSLCFDIRQVSTGGRYVTDGGANWPFSREGHARRRAGEQTEDDIANGRPAIFVAFAALNRPWWQRRPGDERQLPVETEDAIDQVYEGSGADAVWFDTVFHEFGHHLQRHWGEPPTREQQRALGGSRWGSYLSAIPYGGNTGGAGEGFAEACRYVLNGEGIRCRGYRGCAALVEEIEQAFATIGMPRADSVAAAQTAILRHQGKL